jgi:hypothetical protein
MEPSASTSAHGSCMVPSTYTVCTATQAVTHALTHAVPLSAPGAVGTVALDAAGDMVPNSKTYTVFKFGPGGALVPAA